MISALTSVSPSNMNTTSIGTTGLTIRARRKFLNQRASLFFLFHGSIPFFLPFFLYLISVSVFPGNWMCKKREKESVRGAEKERYSLTRKLLLSPVDDLKWEKKGFSGSTTTSTAKQIDFSISAFIFTALFICFINLQL